MAKKRIVIIGNSAAGLADLEAFRKKIRNLKLHLSIESPIQPTPG